MSFFVVGFLLFTGVVQAANHYGERDYLSYKIEYLNPLGETIVSESGIDFIYNGYSSHLNKFLPMRYYGSYPLYFSGGILNFSVIIKNESRRTYRNLEAEIFQEFLNIEGLAGEPQYEDVALKLEEAGKMFGGWKNSLNNPEKKNRGI